MVNAPQVFAGYWQNEDATADAFISIDGKDFFRTGDIGYYDKDGYFYFVDRLKRMINVSGLKVWPAEVEAILHSHPPFWKTSSLECPTSATEIGYERL